ncbi:MAG: phosphatidylserine/phosphatidylglycerophosphate/cardiolipin synthase family protein [Saprospiraceae bacterium]
MNMKLGLLVCIFWLLVFQAFSQDKVILLDDPETSLKIRVQMIRESKSTLDMATFIYGNDEVSTQVLFELVQAAQRGVKIRIIIDGMNNKIPMELMDYLIDHDIRIKIFNPFSVKKLLGNVTRMHSKIMICDDEKYIIGGRNIVNTYFYIGNQKNFKDREVYVQGRSGLTAKRSFEDLWFSAVMNEDHGSQFAHTEKRNIKIVTDYFSDWDTIPQLRNREMQNILDDNEMHISKDVRLIWDRPESFKFVNKNTTNYLVNIINTTKSSIYIESPYVVFSDTLYQALQSAINRGVKVQIITNSLSTSDSYLVLATYYKERDQLIDLGFDIWEYHSENEYLHTKMFVFDEKFVTIGSYNLDMLSANINTECLVQFFDQDIVKESLDYFNSTKAYSKKARVNEYLPTLFEDQINIENLKKYSYIKVFQWTISPFIRQYL